MGEFEGESYIEAMDDTNLLLKYCLKNTQLLIIYIFRPKSKALKIVNGLNNQSNGETNYIC